MVTLDKPIGIRFAHTIDGQFFVEALAKKVRRKKFKPFQNILTRILFIFVLSEEPKMHHKVLIPVFHISYYVEGISEVSLSNSIYNCVQCNMVGKLQKECHGN